ncbi:endolytic transglycosylase MltG [Streptomyces triticirhizae]|uniref:Endolytic murein transglycosylase n=1 Tax=Streptomyces triticirhizae TaxID=2483353 RepID=A0A3M2L072_9ACTN|nr:endolytic transglycosylase MltG [Streptomyces triticirhizae]RMI29195.1 endolytic transglycosylase MltG [Streptomyces triticirhizae]
MTDYGRGSGSEPWYPEDPLYGERNWPGGPEGYDPNGQGQGQPPGGAGDFGGYGGPGPDGQPAGYPPAYQDPTYQGHQGQPGPGYQDPGYQGGQAGWDTGAHQHPTHSQEQGYPAGGYPNQGGHGGDTYGGQGGQGYDTGGYDTSGYDTGSYHTGGYNTGGYQGGSYDTGSYDTGGYQAGGYDTGSYRTGGYDTGGYASPGYDTGAQGAVPHQGQGVPHGHAPPPGQRGPAQQPQGATQAMPAVDVPHARDGDHPRGDGGEGPGTDPETGWDPGPDQGESDFFRRTNEDDDRDYRDDRGDDDGGRRAGSGRRRGCGCLLLVAVVVGGVGGAGWYGYQFYQDRFGPAPDFEGEGHGEVEVEIPAGSVLSQMGNILKEAGVVKSHDAFVEAAEAAEASIQPGVYTLRQEMSAEAAVAALTDPEALNVLTIPEGKRVTEIYAMIDERLGLEEGATEEVAETTDLGLPDWAEGDPEGFLFPARYDVGGETTPEELLTEMVERAEAEFDGISLETAAEQLGHTPREVLTIASLIQAEAQEDEEFGKVSRVIYNRLDIDMRLQFDSTINYALGRFTLDTTIEDTQLDSPYNTYVEYGLPPGPIDNPGHQALEAALNPTEGDWLFFVTVEPGDTRFTADDEEHERNVRDFNEAQARAREEGDG